jgi:quercetin dioxygenase-like cupin family protein
VPWQSSVLGARSKSVIAGARRVRIVEFTSDFVEAEWCETGHVGLVLKGQLEIDFRDHVVLYAEGEGILISPGVAHGHKARAVTPTVQLFLVEDA